MMTNGFAELSVNSQIATIFIMYVVFLCIVYFVTLLGFTLLANSDMSVSTFSFWFAIVSGWCVGILPVIIARDVTGNWLVVASAVFAFGVWPVFTSLYIRARVGR